jgi:hypothetical protein
MFATLSRFACLASSRCISFRSLRVGGEDSRWTSSLPPIATLGAWLSMKAVDGQPWRESNSQRVERAWVCRAFSSELRTPLEARRQCNRVCGGDLSELHLSFVRSTHYTVTAGRGGAARRASNICTAADGTHRAAHGTAAETRPSHRALRLGIQSCGAAGRADRACRRQHTPSETQLGRWLRTCLARLDHRRERSARLAAGNRH